MNRTFTYQESVGRLEALYRQPHEPAARVGLSRAERLLDALGNPHRRFRSVHVTGSSGKGSTTTMAGAILQSAGFRTGLFRSPHLLSYRERINVNGADIDEASWCRCFAHVWPVVEAMQANLLPQYSAGRPSLYEVLFALMSVHFAESGVEWGAVEVGIGGRLDATNLLQSDVAVVTNVSLEHTKMLGNTVSAIAREKAAIIKPGSTAVTASQDPDALEVIEARSREVDAPLLRVGRDVVFRTKDQTLYRQELELAARGQTLSLSLPLAGGFQAANAATAYASAVALQERGVPIDAIAASRGLESVRIPGRFEIASAHPLIVLDGAHHPASAWELRRTVERLLAGRAVTLLFAAMSDKDVFAMAEALGPLCARVIVTRVPHVDRAQSTAALAAAFERAGVPVTQEEDVDEALRLAVDDLDREGVVLATGSLYLVGYLRGALAATGARG